MHRRLRLTVLALPVALTVALLFGSGLSEAQDAPKPAPAAEEHPLEAAMSRIEGAMKSLRRSVRDVEQRSASLTELDALQHAAIDAKSLVPPMAKKLEGAAREELLLAYRRTLTVVLQRALELEQAVIDGDVERSKTAWEALSALEDEGHEKFAPVD